MITGFSKIHMARLPILLRQYRKRAGLTQKALAERIHFSHTVISRTEQPDGHYMPSGHYLTTFAKALELTEAEREELYLDARIVAGPPQMVSAPTVPEQQAAKPERKRSRLAVRIGLGLIVVILLLVLSFRSTASESARFYRQTAEGELLYGGTFEDGDLTDWKNLNNGRWEVYEISGNRVLGVRGQDPDVVPNAYLLSSEDWTDYTFSADVIFESGVYEQVFLVVRSQRRSNCTGYRVGGNRLGVSIFRFDPVNGCNGEVLAEDIHFPLEEGRLYRTQVEVIGDRIRYFVDGELILEAQDDTYLQGGVGLLAYQVRSAYFDGIEVRKTTVRE